MKMAVLIKKESHSLFRFPVSNTSNETHNGSRKNESVMVVTDDRIFTI